MDYAAQARRETGGAASYWDARRGGKGSVNYFLGLWRKGIVGLPLEPECKRDDMQIAAGKAAGQ